MIGRPTEGYTGCPRVNGQRPSTCTRAEMGSMKGEQIGSILFDIQTELQQTEYLGIYTK